MADDDPSDVVSERFFEAVFGDHPLGRPIGGSPESIGAVTRDAVWEHYRANYRAQDLVITVAGAVDHDVLVGQVVAALERAGWDLSVAASPVPRRDARPEVIQRGHSAGRRRAGRSSRPTSSSASPGSPRPPSCAPTLAVLNSVLGGGMSQPAVPGDPRAARTRLLGVLVHPELLGRRPRGSVRRLLAGEGRAGRRAHAVASSAGSPPTASPTTSSRRAIGQLGGASALALEDSDTRMSRLGRSELTLGEFLDLDETLRRLAQ